MRSLIKKLPRYIVTPETAQYRLFMWQAYPVIPDKNLVVIARSDDVTFGILQSTIHEVWSLRLGTSLEDRPRYTSTTTFATFPFPDEFPSNRLPSSSKASALATPIEDAAKHLNELRDNWLNPDELVERVPEIVPGFPDRLVARPGKEDELKKRTLTNLYNANPTWLRHAHAALDTAVAAAYNWQWPIAKDAILSNLLDLNKIRAKDGDGTLQLHIPEAAEGPKQKATKKSAKKSK
jgi:hypothetical protein